MSISKTIRPWLWFAVIIVSIGGFRFPLLGYFVPIVMLTLLAISPFRGRWFCGNLCPRGSFNDFVLGKVSLRRKIHSFFFSIKFRVFIFALLMGGMVFRLAHTGGLYEKIGMVFIIMCLATTLIAIMFGVLISPRTWCSFCPMGTMQRILGGTRYQLQIDRVSCRECRVCHKACPMHLEVIDHDLKKDCIKCGMCIDKCPAGALSF